MSMKQNFNAKGYGLWLLLILLVGILAVGCSGGESPDNGAVSEQSGESAVDKTVKIGIIDTYSGPAAGYAEDSLAGFKLALEEAEESGLDFKIEFVKRDSEFKVNKGLEWARELVEREKVDMLVGTINSAVALAVSEYAKEQQVPFLVWNAQSENITGASGHRYVFGMMPNSAMSGMAGAVAMAKETPTKYWLAGSDYEYGHSIIDNFWSNLQQLKPEVEMAGESWWPVGEADFTPYLNAIRLAKPDAIAIGAGGADMVPVMKSIAATGLNKEMDIWIHTGTDLGTLSPLGSEAPEDVMGTATYHYYFPDTEENKAYSAKFKETNGREPGFTALNGYVTGKAITKALESVGEADMEKMVDTLAGLTLESPVGKITIREYDHQVVAPMFFGTTAKEAGNENLISKDITALNGEDFVPSIEDIKQARGE